jgi:2-polyprenyl-3-methyl-5-hydroxy-6-metoxy-1,4-benzoquinol methylase
MEQNKNHWETVFSTKTEKEVSWYQEYPKTSIDFVKNSNIAFDAKIIDIGGGDSYFIDSLIRLGYSNLYLLDISENAIEKIKTRLGENVSKVTFIVSDILDFTPEIKFDFWHDRACFHFLTTEKQINMYSKIVTKALSNLGNLVIGTFSENGPIKCSGLKILQYSEQKLEAIFNTNFKLISSKTENHETPFKTIQNFLFCSFIKK